MTDKLTCPECGIEIDEHLASRCLDEWVITSIGVPKPVYAHRSYLHLDPIYDDTGFWYWAYDDHGDVCEWHPIAVSEGWAEAGKVVEKFSENYEVIISRQDGSDVLCSCLYITESEKDFGDWFFAKAPDAPLAICRAAIKAKAVTDAT